MRPMEVPSQAEKGQNMVNKNREKSLIPYHLKYLW